MPDRHDVEPMKEPARKPERSIRIEELIPDGGELRILHAGEVYRLRITRQNKLILTK